MFTAFVSPLALAPAAFLAGVLMFLAPCTLPVVPAYLAFIAGVPEGDIAGGAMRRGIRGRIFRNALAFVIGFSLIFILLGSFAAFVGALLGPWRYVLARAAGVFLILFGVTMLGFFRIPVFSGEWRARLPKALTLGHPMSSFLVGVLFALGWSPCVGPILGSVLFIASASATALQGAVLLGVFSLGLSVPFLLCALLIGESFRFAPRFGRVAAALQVLGGIILIVLGILMLSDNMGLLISWGFGLFDSTGYGKLLNYM